MARDPRLALAKNFRQFADRQFAMRAQYQQPQPRRLGDRAQGGEQIVQGDIVVHGVDHRLKHIKISLYRQPHFAACGDHIADSPRTRDRCHLEYRCMVNDFYA
jgi:hypothetical protein